MSYTKRQFIEAAFEEIGLAAYTFDLSPQQIEAAMRRLDTMMAEWNAKGIRLAYPLPGSPQDSDLDAETTVPDSANEAIITNLGIRIAPSYGKQVMAETKVAAKMAYNTLLSRATMPLEQQFPGTMPAGAGNKSYDDPFLQGAAELVDSGPDGALEYN